VPLTGIRVIDLTRLLPGPYATRLMAEMGADVIKIEDPKGGDYARWMPPLAGDPPTSSLFNELNRGKRSVTLDLKRPEAQEALRLLAAQGDVLVDGFRPGVLARCGCDPRELMAANSRLIYCAMTGFGLTGPDLDRAGHDIGYLARSGALALSGTAASPWVSAVQVADIGAALAALSGVLAALFERARTGVGQVVDISLAELGFAFGAANFGSLHGGRVPRRGQEVLDGSHPCYSVYRTRDDRFLAVGALEPKFWAEFVKAIGLPELAMN
jgi:crotonobetainyl-CoA:carnitine CoA-transferase CaiB-like acyl-CoA transferase